MWFDSSGDGEYEDGDDLDNSYNDDGDVEANGENDDSDDNNNNELMMVMIIVVAGH